MKTIKLPIFEIIVEVDKKNLDCANLTGTIRSKLKDETENKVDDEYCAAIDGIESLILAHACAGVDITSTAYLKGVEVACEAATNNL